MNKVVVIGSINQDVVVSLERAPNGGETVVARNASMFPGGKGANQAVAAALAGANVTLIGRVGSDAFGPALKEYLRARGLDLKVASDGVAGTGMAVIFVEDNGENRIAVIAGANALVGNQEVAAVESIGEGDYLVVQNEIPIRTTVAALVAARTRGATTIYNPAPAMPIDGRAIAATDILVVNEHEFTTVLKGVEIDISNRAGLREIVVSSARLLKLDLILTLGTAGVIASIDGSVVDLLARTVRVVDTTGAGDCFVGAFVAFLAAGRERPDALIMANVAASLSVQSLGASSSFPTREEIETAK